MGVSDNNLVRLESMKTAVLARLHTLVDKKESLSDKEKKALSRTLWRVGELEIPDAIPVLIKLATDNPAPSLENYCIAWSLGRLRAAEGLDVINLLGQKAGPNDRAMRRISLEVRYHLTPDADKLNYLQNLVPTLPQEITQALETGDAATLSEAIIVCCNKITKEIEGGTNNRGGFAAFVNKTEGTNDQAAPEDESANSQTDLVVETLALLSLEDNTIRRALLKFIQNVVPAGPAAIGAFKTLWKIAEFRDDGELFAALLYRLEKNKHSIPSYVWDADVGYMYGMKSSIPYYIRRSWRTIRRLGEIGDRRYVEYAKAILLSVSDNDKKEIERKRFVQWRWNSSTRSYDTTERNIIFSEYTSFVAFGHILYDNSNKFGKSPSNYWVIKDETAQDQRPEAFPELWDQAPEVLFELLATSYCDPVHAFATRALRDNPEFLQEVPLHAWFALIERPFRDTALFALEALRIHYADQSPDIQLIRLCLTSRFKELREAGEEWLRRAPYLLRDNLELLVWMITCNDEDLRLMSREYMEMFEGQSEQQQALFELLIGATLDMPEDVDAGVIENIGWIFLNPCKEQLSIITFEAIGLFVSHPSLHVNLLGAQILGAQNLRPHDIPSELYGKLFNSPSELVRAEAISLMSNLEDAELALWDEMIGNLLLSEQPAVRQVSRQLLTRAIRADEHFGAKIIQKLLAVLFKSETAEGMHDDLHEIIKNELKPSWPGIDKNQLWRMLTAKAKGVQRVAASILQTRDIHDYTVRQWAALGGNPSLSVRSWAWRAYEANIELVKTNIDGALHILGSSWEDSRTFGFQYFSTHFPFDQWSEKQVISLCDNKHKEVQELGRKLVFEHIQLDRGSQYLMALSEHPSMAMQKFLGQFLKRLASENTDNILQMEQYFVSVLSRVNKGRAAKNQVLEFLSDEAGKDRKIAEMLARIMQSLSLSAAIHDKARSLEIMSNLSARYPGLAMPVKVKKPEVRQGRTADQTVETRG